MVEVPLIFEAEQINSPQFGENINIKKRKTNNHIKYTVAHKLKYYAFLI